MGKKVLVMLPRRARQAKKNIIASADAIRGETFHSDFAGTNNPHHIIFVHYYADVYATYVHPNVDLISYSIWIPKTLVANKREPIEIWGPKPKQ
jgi:hypothetical protein